MPRGHPRYRIVKLLDEAIRRDLDFIDLHRTTLFQYRWNTCLWYDCPEAAQHCTHADPGHGQALPWTEDGETICRLLDSRLVVREGNTP